MLCNELVLSKLEIPCGTKCEVHIWFPRTHNSRSGRTMQMVPRTLMEEHPDTCRRQRRGEGKNLTGLTHAHCRPCSRPCESTRIGQIGHWRLNSVRTITHQAQKVHREPRNAKWKGWVGLRSTWEKRNRDEWMEGKEVRTRSPVVVSYSVMTLGILIWTESQTSILLNSCFTFFCSFAVIDWSSTFPKFDFHGNMRGKFRHPDRIKSRPHNNL